MKQHLMVIQTKRVQTEEERNRRAERYLARNARRRAARKEARVGRLVLCSAAVFLLALAVKLGTAL